MRKLAHWLASPAVAGLYVFVYGWYAGLAAGAAVLLALLCVRGLLWPFVDLEAERDCAALALIGAVFGCALSVFCR